MKGFAVFVIFCALSLAAYSPPVRAQIDPRVKAVAVMALYGTVGGFLLGTASLAFHKDGRSISRGASLGLYAGLLFGGYVVGSHYLARQRGLQGPNLSGQEDIAPDAHYYDRFEAQLWSPGRNLRPRPEGELHPFGTGPFGRKSDFPRFYFNLFQFRF